MESTEYEFDTFKEAVEAGKKEAEETVQSLCIRILTNSGKNASHYLIVLLTSQI